jgi:succinylglutamic semialdehyde dehydrogenase
LDPRTRNAFSKTNPVNNQQIWSGHEANVADVEQLVMLLVSISCLGTLRLEDRIAIIERFASLLEQIKMNWLK